MQSFLPPEAFVQDREKGRGQVVSQLHLAAVWIQILLAQEQGHLLESPFICELPFCSSSHPFVSLA